MPARNMGSYLGRKLFVVPIVTIGDRFVELAVNITLIGLKRLPERTPRPRQTRLRLKTCRIPRIRS